MRPQRNQPGFALLLTLVLLMIGAIALSHVARQSAGEALHALDAHEELQRRWAVTSCRETLLPRAEGLLVKAAQVPVDEHGVPQVGARQTPLGTDLRISCELAGLSYDIVFTDEQAKYNPTLLGAMLLDEKPLVDRRELKTHLRQLAGFGAAAARDEGSLVLRPLVGIDADGQPVEYIVEADEMPDLYASYGQLFEGVSPEFLLGDASRPGAASQLTCWGNGQLNLRRTPRSLVKRIMKPLLGVEGVEQLLDARRAEPGLGVTDWMEAVDDVEPDRMALAGALMTERSRVQGLWVVAHGRSRSWYTFSVRQEVSPEEQAAAESALQSSRDPQESPTPTKPDQLIRRYDFAW